jgi:hypothetical protein
MLLRKVHLLYGLSAIFSQFRSFSTIFEVNFLHMVTVRKTSTPFFYLEKGIYWYPSFCIDQCTNSTKMFWGTSKLNGVNWLWDLFEKILIVIEVEGVVYCRQLFSVFFFHFSWLHLSRLISFVWLDANLLTRRLLLSCVAWRSNL